MIQCSECEFCEIGPDGRKMFKCDPFSTIKEPECLAKWQIIRLDMLLGSYQAMMAWNRKLAPIQDKIFKYGEREISDMEETDSWKIDPEEEDEGRDDPWAV